MRQIKSKLTKKAVALSLLAGICLYAGIYAYAVNSDAYLSAKQEILLSEKLVLEVGKIQSVELPIFGRFKTHWEGTGDDSTATAKLKVKVIGSMKSLNLIVRTKMSEGVWKIQSAQHDGRHLSL